MANYLYLEHVEQPLTERFSTETVDDDEILGLSVWRRYTGMLLDYLSEDPQIDRQNIIATVRAEVNRYYAKTGQYQEFYREELAATEELILILLLRQLRTIELLPNKRCPKLFVSHRQCDWIYALQIAKIAASEKFDYWVDILDPTLLNLPARLSHSPRLLSLLTACIIEMALINCTHVIACMTPYSRGTLWQPYEYGRITEIPSYYKKAGTWVHPNLSAADFPEYMYLGKITRLRTDIEGWLNKEYKIWSGEGCVLTKTGTLDDIDLPNLPEQIESEFPDNVFPYTIKIEVENNPAAEWTIKEDAGQQEFLRDLGKRILAHKVKVIENASATDTQRKRKEFESWRSKGYPVKMPAPTFRITF